MYDVATSSNSGGLFEIPGLSDTETVAVVDVSPDSDSLVTGSVVDFQVELFLVLGIIIGILLIGDRRF